MKPTHRLNLITSGIFLAFLLPFTVSAEPVTLYAAGSLKAALDDVVAVYEKTYQKKVTAKFAPSGLLRKAIENGETPDVFASANMKHPQILSDAGWGSPVVLFARNRLCAMAQPEVGITTDTVLQTLLNKSIRVGTSTPGADPSGDYAWELFRKADQIEKGSFDTLSKKALQLTGGPNSPKPPEGKNKYGWVMGEKKADVFLTYCTNAVLAQKEVKQLRIIPLPEPLSVGADYGLLVRKDAPAEAWHLAMYILSPRGQCILGRYGFKTSGVPEEAD